MDAAQVLMVGLDSRHRIVFCNDCFRRASGCSDKEVVGRPFWDLVDAAAAGSPQSPGVSGSLLELPREFEAQLLTEAGESPTIRWQVYPGEADAQQPSRWLITGTDVTYRRALEDRNERLASLVQTIHRFSRLILVENDVERLAGSICRVLAARQYRGCWIALIQEDTFDRVYGSPPQSKLGHFESQLRAGELPTCVRRAMDTDEVILMSNVAANCQHCIMSDIETSTDGLIIALRHARRIYGVLVVHLAAGTVTEEDKSLFSQLATSLTHALESLEIRRDREKAHQTLRERSRVLDALFTHVLTPLALLDSDFNFVRVNRAYAEAGDRPISDYLGRNHFELYPSEAKEIFQTVLETKQPYGVVARPFSYPEHPEWGISYWDWTLAPLLDDEGQVEFLILSLNDVTELKQSEQNLHRQRQKQRELVAQLAMAEQQERWRMATVLHDELAQFLVAARLNLQAVDSELPEGDASRTVDRAAELVGQAIAQTRSLSRRLSPPMLSPESWPQALQELVEGMASQWQIQLALEVSGESELLSEEICFTIFQAIRELLNNAHHHGEADTARVAVEVSNETVTVKVRDDGLGFDVSALGQELEQSGGFGLFNIRERIRYLEGRMDIASEPGEGTEVTISVALMLPVDRLKHSSETGEREDGD